MLAEAPEPVEAAAPPFELPDGELPQAAKTSDTITNIASIIIFFIGFPSSIPIISLPADLAFSRFQA